MKKKNKNFRYSKINNHRYTKFNHEYIFLWVENAVKLVKISCLLIIKAVKIENGCQQNVSATDMPFLLML